MSYTILYPRPLILTGRSSGRSSYAGLASWVPSILYEPRHQYTPYTMSGQVSNNLVILNKVDPRIHQAKTDILLQFSGPCGPHSPLQPLPGGFRLPGRTGGGVCFLAPYLRRALTSADLVVASSERLYRDSLTVNPNTILVPNGAILITSIELNTAILRSLMI